MSVLASGFALLLAALQGEAYVADGQTLVIAGTPLQLDGIDVPERRSAAGQAARAAVQSIVDGHTVLCRSGGDRHGMTILATCTYDGRDLAAELVARGLALDCAAMSEGRYRALEPEGVRDLLVQSPHCLPKG